MRPVKRGICPTGALLHMLRFTLVGCDLLQPMLVSKTSALKIATTRLYKHTKIQNADKFYRNCVKKCMYAHIK